MAANAPAASKTDDIKFTITVSCTVDGERRAVSYTVFKRTLMGQVFDSSVQFFKVDPTQVILVVKNKVALTHKCVEDYRLADKSVLELIHLKDAPTIDLTLRDQAGNSKALTASSYHPLSDVVKTFCKHLAEETGFSDLYHGGIALDLDASPASIGLKTGEQLFCYCYKAACKLHSKGEQKALRFIKFYFSDWKYGYKTFPIFRHDISTPMEVLIRTFCTWRGLDYEQTGFLYSYTYKQVQPGDTATSKALADGDTILAYSRQELQGRLWDAVLAGNTQHVVDLLEQGAELSTSIGPEEWGKHPLHAAVANGHVELVKLLLSRGCEPNQLDYASDPPLWHAVENNLVELVELLLERGATAADVSMEGRPKDATGYSACPHAARKGHAETLRCLLAAGGNPWLPDADGYTSYDYALDHAKPSEVVRSLLEGDPRFGEMQRGFQAAYQRMCQMLKRTQRYPALGCPCRTCNSLLEIRAAETEASRQVREQVGCVALVRAVQAGGPHCLEVMELLYKHGALLDGQDYDGRTALHQAIRYNRLAEASWLISKGAHLDIPDFEGLLPLHQAGCSGFCDITKLLAEAGAPLNLHTIKYVAQEALDAQAKKQDGSKKAKRKQLDVSGLTTIGGNSPLALAIRHGHGAVVEYLLSQNAIFDLKNAADSSAFHAALDKGSAAIAGLLLQHINKKAPAGGAGSGNGAGSSNAVSTVLKSPAKGAAASGAAGAAGAAAVADKAAKRREAKAAKENRNNSDAKEKGGKGDKDGGSDGADTASSKDGGRDCGGAAAAAAAAGNGGATGGAAASEPPVAVDAGAGLREMVMKERERLRQQLGLSSGSAAEAKPEPKPMLPIFARNNSAPAASGVGGTGATANSAAAPPAAAAARPVAAASAGAVPAPAAAASPAPASSAAASSNVAAPAAADAATAPQSSTSAAAARAGAAAEEKVVLASTSSSGEHSSSAASSSASASGPDGSKGSSFSSTPLSSTSASPKSLTDEDSLSLDEHKAPSAAAPAPAPPASRGAGIGSVAAPAPPASSTPPQQQQEDLQGVGSGALASKPAVLAAQQQQGHADADALQAASSKEPPPAAKGKEPAKGKAAAAAAGGAASSAAAVRAGVKGNEASSSSAASGSSTGNKAPAVAAAATPAAPAPAASPIKVKFRAKPLEPPPAAAAAAAAVAGGSGSADDDPAAVSAGLAQRTAAEPSIPTAATAMPAGDVSHAVIPPAGKAAVRPGKGKQQQQQPAAQPGAAAARPPPDPALHPQQQPTSPRSSSRVGKAAQAAAAGALPGSGRASNGPPLPGPGLASAAAFPPLPGSTARATPPFIVQPGREAEEAMPYGSATPRASPRPGVPDAAHRPALQTAAAPGFAMAAPLHAGGPYGAETLQQPHGTVPEHAALLLLQQLALRQQQQPQTLGSPQGGLGQRAPPPGFSQPRGTPVSQQQQPVSPLTHGTAPRAPGAGRLLPGGHSPPGSDASVLPDLAHLESMVAQVVDLEDGLPPSLGSAGLGSSAVAGLRSPQPGGMLLHQQQQQHQQQRQQPDRRLDPAAAAWPPGGVAEQLLMAQVPAVHQKGMAEVPGTRLLAASAAQPSMPRNLLVPQTRVGLDPSAAAAAGGGGGGGPLRNGLLLHHNQQQQQQRVAGIGVGHHMHAASPSRAGGLVPDPGAAALLHAAAAAAGGAVGSGDPRAGGVNAASLAGRGAGLGTANPSAAVPKTAGVAEGLGRQASHTPLARYDSEAVLPDEAALGFGAGADPAGPGGQSLRAGVGKPAAAAALFSIEHTPSAWGAAGSSSGSGGGGSSNWQALAEKQQKGFNEAMSSLTPAAAAAAQGAQQLFASEAAPALPPLPAEFPGAGNTSGSADKAAAPAPPPPPPVVVELEPLPELPASLFDEDDDDGAALGFVSSAEEPAGPSDGPMGHLLGGAQRPLSRQGTPLGSRRTGGGLLPAAVAAGGIGATDMQPPPPPPMAGAGRIMYAQGPIAGGGMGGPVGGPYGHAHMMYGHHRHHHGPNPYSAAPAGPYGGPQAAYGDWGYAPGPYGSMYRPPMAPAAMAPPMYGSTGPRAQGLGGLGSLAAAGQAGGHAAGPQGPVAATGPMAGQGGNSWYGAGTKQTSGAAAARALQDGAPPHAATSGRPGRGSGRGASRK